MKINRDSIKAMARHVWTGHRLVYDHELIHPSRDWLIGLGSAVLIGLLIIGWSVQLYTTYRDAPLRISDGVETEVMIYRAPLVESARATLLERAVAAAALTTEKNNPVPVPSPSDIATSTATSSPVATPSIATTTTKEVAAEEVVGEVVEAELSFE